MCWRFAGELATVKLGLSTERRIRQAAYRVAELISASAGELTRVGTFPDGGETLSAGNT